MYLHTVKDLACSFSCYAVGDAHVISKPSKASVARPAAPAKPKGRIPEQVKQGYFRQRRELFTNTGFGIDNCSGDLQMLVDGLTSNKQSHDFTAAFENLRGLWSNDDTKRYKLARRILEGDYEWMEDGIAQPDRMPEGAESKLVGEKEIVGV